MQQRLRTRRRRFLPQVSRDAAMACRAPRDPACIATWMIVARRDVPQGELRVARCLLRCQRRRCALRLIAEFRDIPLTSTCSWRTFVGC